MVQRICNAGETDAIGWRKIGVKGYVRWKKLHENSGEHLCTKLSIVVVLGYHFDYAVSVVFNKVIWKSFDILLSQGREKILFILLQEKKVEFGSQGHGGGKGFVVLVSGFFSTKDSPLGL